LLISCFSPREFKNSYHFVLVKQSRLAGITLPTLALRPQALRGGRYVDGIGIQSNRASTERSRQHPAVYRGTSLTRGISTSQYGSIESSAYSNSRSRSRNPKDILGLSTITERNITSRASHVCSQRGTNLEDPDGIRVALGVENERGRDQHRAVRCIGAGRERPQARAHQDSTRPSPHHQLWLFPVPGSWRSYTRSAGRFRPGVILNH